MFHHWGKSFKMPGKCASNENENHSHLDVSFLSKLNGITRLYLPRAYIHWSLQYIELQLEFLFIGSSLWWYEEGNHLHVWLWHVDYWKKKKWNSSSGYCYLEVYNHGLQLLWGSLLFSLPINYPVWCGQKLVFSLQKVTKVVLFHQGWKITL